MSEANLTQPRARLHPLVAVAAAATIIACAVAIAAVTGHLQGSKAGEAPEAAPASAPAPSQDKHRSVAAPTHLASAPPSVAQAKPHCAACGVVLDVKEVVVKGQGSGVGAVAGAAVGGVVAHEVFDGRNQGLATIAGAAGGALAGNAIEKDVKTKKHYEVALRMDDGSTRTLAFAEAPAWKPGDKVRVEGATLAPR
ncbi:MAG: glycine zipper 2TM domain-containing protein [Betaproteobacteria bacterium]|nr:glycine zipper 2TM domain-containing protein [Betaproteobacteria bacterium]